MIAIDIFKENHRFSEQTRHLGPHSIVDAANPAAAAEDYPASSTREDRDDDP
jgi:hypothetical protein